MKKIAKKQKLTIEQIVDITSYGMQWYNDNAENYSYNAGAQEATAHALACMITQNCLVNPYDGVPTADAVQLIYDFPSKELLTKRIKRYIKPSC